MMRVAEFRIPADGFPLGQVLSALPDARLTLETLVPTGSAVVPYFWVTGADPSAIQAALSERSELRSVRFLDRVDDASLFRLTWDTDVLGVVAGLRESGVAVLSGTGADGEWHFQLRGDDDELSAFHEYCRTHDVPVELARLQPYHGRDASERYGLTDDQREALLLAFERGYYQESHEVTLADLAAELGISRQAFAARLRRGYSALVAGRSPLRSAPGDK